MPPEITAERLTSLFRPRSVALVGAANKSAFSSIAYHNLARFGFGDRTYLVNRRGAETHGRATVTSCQQIGEPVDVAYLMVPQAGMVEALEDAAAAGIRNAVVLSSGYGEAARRAGRRMTTSSRAPGRWAWSCSAPTTSGSPTSSTGSRSAPFPGCPTARARSPCCRRAGPVPRPCSTSPGHPGALRLESFFVGQVVGSFARLRPAGEITRQIVSDCETRLAELAALLPSSPAGAS